ncbi:MAG: patatin-like phospholipase family protein, partial [Janthinobacterium lividum]
MSRWAKALLAPLVTLLLGCVQQAEVPSFKEAGYISVEDGHESGYRAIHTGREPGREPALRHTYFVLAFSGGGTRAAAFAHGALRELGATPSPDAPGLTLLEAVDMVSSTSGGSVAATNFVLRGPAGYRFLDQNGGFLAQNGMTDLIVGTLDPLDIAERMFTEKSRIQLLSAWFQRMLFRDWTFDTIAQQRYRHPPLLVLNSSDMATGEPFPF